ncbi:MAG TPA: FAD-binding oxidoreductase, partial [Anaerolineales bacterium]|nr:FAD-binding oxidoreductase [Anaerolineales bacterium]
MPAPSALPDFFNQLRPRIAGELRTDAFYRTLYSTDASLYQVMPYGVLLPKTVDDVQAALELAARYRIPIVPRTAGTSLAGQAVNEALVIDFTSHLNRILEVNAEERWVRVQPGVVLDHLNQYLRPFDLQYGPDPASSNRAALGGIVANNATGSHSIVYGMTADHVLETDVILADGTRTRFGFLNPAELDAKHTRGDFEGSLYRKIRATLENPANISAIREGTPRHWRRCGGYNVERLLGDGNFSYRLPQDTR